MFGSVYEYTHWMINWIHPHRSCLTASGDRRDSGDDIGVSKSNQKLKNWWWITSSPLAFGWDIQVKTKQCWLTIATKKQNWQQVDTWEPWPGNGMTPLEYEESRTKTLAWRGLLLRGQPAVMLSSSFFPLVSGWWIHLLNGNACITWQSGGDGGGGGRDWSIVMTMSQSPISLVMVVVVGKELLWQYHEGEEGWGVAMIMPCGDGGRVDVYV